MKMITLRCPECGRVVRDRDEDTSATRECPDCGKPQLVPAKGIPRTYVLTLAPIAWATFYGGMALDFAVALRARERARRARVHLDRGVAYCCESDHDRAVAQCTKAIEIRPDFAEAYYDRGTTYLRNGDHNRAIADFTKAIKLDPDGPVGEAARESLELAGE